MRVPVKILAVLLACSPVLAADWPQWRGPNRDGVSTEKGLLRKWPAKGPTLVWKTNKAGSGLSGFAVVAGVTYTMGERGGDEFAIAFGKDGKVAWETKLGPTYDFEANNYSRGPNMTPSVADGHVYAITTRGLLACLTTGGKIVWKKDIAKEMKGSVNNVGWGEETKGFGTGYCWAPQVVGDKLLIAPGGPGGLLALLEAKTGKEIWRSKKITEEATYGSPTAGKVGGVEMAFYVTQHGFRAVSMKDGSLIYQNKRDEPYPDVVCATPSITGDVVQFSVGYGGGSAEAYKFDGKTFKPHWEGKKEIGSKLGCTVVYGKHVFGYHEDRSWMCQDLATGDVVWPLKRQRQKLGAGACVAADGLLFALDEKGKAGLMEASPKGYEALGEFDLPEKAKDRKSGIKVWTHPALSDGKLYLRDQEWVYCYDVKKGKD